MIFAKSKSRLLKRKKPPTGIIAKKVTKVKKTVNCLEDGKTTFPL